MAKYHMKLKKNLKPYTVEDREWPIQADGVGMWGRANANGPGFAVLIEELGVGESTYLPPKTSFDLSSFLPSFISIFSFTFIHI